MGGEETVSFRGEREKKKLEGGDSIATPALERKGIEVSIGLR